VVTALLVTLAGVVYLSQVLRLSHWRDPVLAIPFAFAEIFSVVTLTSLCWTVTRWRRRAHRPPTYQPVDVFIPTLDEPLEVLEATIVAARDLRWPDRVRVHLLDDGDRSELELLVAELGVRYHARSEHSMAKAGNLNSGLALTAADPAPVVCVLDADHVADPELLERTVGHLDDPGIGLVQTPQYYRLDGSRAVKVAAEQQALLCDRIGPSRDAFDTMFCMGTNFVVDRAVLDQVGGFPDAITEDVILSLELLQRGYRVAYVHEPLAIGLAPPTLPAFMKQQTRWALGSMELLTRRRDLLRGIGPVAGWQYGTLPFHWFYGITFPIYLLIAISGVAFGWQPFDATSGALFWSQIVWGLSALGGLLVTARGVLSFDGGLVKWGSWIVSFRAIRQGLQRGRPAWEIAQKVRHAREQSGSTAYLRLSAAVVAVMVLAVAVRGYEISTLGPMVVSGTNALALCILALRFRTDDRRKVEELAPS
jgi:cellulose synthase (UDP-forming)